MNPTNLCDELISFVDGELAPERANAFRIHLITCDACQAGLAEAMELDAWLTTLPPPSRRRSTRWVAVAAVSAAAIALLWLRGGQTACLFADQQTRPFEIRFAYHGAASYRAVHRAMLGASSGPTDRIPFAALDELQQRGDRYGVAIARAWNGEGPAGIADDLHKLVPTPSIESDRAALDSLTTSNDNIEPVLASIEALRRSPDQAAAHAARWNYALLLARLELPLSAAAEFRAIARDDEPGWADEAAARANHLEQLGRAAGRDWNAANTAGEHLISTGAPVALPLITQFPGMMRAYFYTAVRTAPDRARVQALEPMARELDRIAGQPLLVDYLRRVAAADFTRRAPLAAAYAQMFASGHPPPELARAIESSNPPGDVVDIVLGAILHLRVIPRNLAAFEQRVAQTRDPWLAALLARVAAESDLQRLDWPAAELRLRTAQSQCTAAIEYQCLSIAIQLGHLYEDRQRVPEAVAVLQKALASARSSGELGKYQDLMKRLADVERFNGSAALCRAYANELVQMSPEDSDFWRAAHMLLVGAAVLDVDGPTARRELALAMSGDVRSLRVAAAYLADIGRLDPQPDDLAVLRRWLASWLDEARQAGTRTPVHQVIANQIEGRLLIELDRTAGSELLNRAIRVARQFPADTEAQRQRTGAYSVLVLDAARNHDLAAALALAAEQLDLPPPGPCTVALVSEDERAAVVVRGSDGRDRSSYDARRPRDRALTVSDELARGLDRCAQVRVIALTASPGQPRILPARFAWSYVTGSGEHAWPGTLQLPADPHTLVVTQTTPPGDLHLPPLADQPLDNQPSTTTLSGPSATPARVLAAMRDASVIRFHTHALMDAGISDASYLALSPEPSGTFQLTAEAVRASALTAHPIVVLAACNAAQGARYQIAPWSLPDGFLAAGARAVFAAAAAIPDAEAEPFFARVLARIRAGAAPAVALRDERLVAQALQPGSWTADVMVFE